MKINKFGINLDEGLPLNSETLDLLYVSCFEETVSQITDWIKDNNTENPLMLGGQIGAGKSTLLTKIFSDDSLSLQPDITLKFDKEGLNLDEGDFLSIILAGFIKRAIEKNIDLSFLKLPAELFNLKQEDWQGLIDLLYPASFSMNSFENKIKARHSISEHSAYIIAALKLIGEKLKEQAEPPLFIFASGLDKYDTGGHAFKVSLKNSINLLSNYKTLYEVNAIHLFLPDKTSPFSAKNDKVFIHTMNDKAIAQVLEKRMGIYAEPIKEELELISEWSGGNPRQAIRLLTHYQAIKKNRKLDKTAILAKAIKKTTDDFFSFAHSPSSYLIKKILKDKEISSTLFSLAGDKDTALEALYGNWIFIRNGSDNGVWTVIVNPLTKAFFEKDKIILEEPEQKLLLQYAEANNMSPLGLGFNMIGDDSSQKNADQLLHEFFSTGFEEPLALNISEVLELISAALLSKDRKERIIIAYEDKYILKAARAYLFAKANSYEYQRVEQCIIQGGKDKNPISQLEEIIHSDTDIISLDFIGQFNKKQLEAIDKYRDKLIDYQMLWWLTLEDLKEYLPHWTQLRELFEFFVLDDELLGSLSVGEIEADLAFFEDLVENEESSEYSMVSNLKIVLEYLKHREGMSNNG
ncbi:MAG: hypothetical protein HN417_09525 [Desulfobacula sp.]|jgi:hypothetical protein|nr:hypothetical protein [Desulfobacula sp.]